MVPQESDGVTLVGGTEGWIAQVIARWPNHRCWDVLVFDPQHKSDVPYVGHGDDRTVRNAQVRSKANDPKHQWREIKL